MSSLIQIKSIPKVAYAEMPQKSPMKWCVLDVMEDGTAVGQHGWWKCKDFLNDSVVYIHTNKAFKMYGYDNELQLNGDLAYVALKNIPVFFEENLGYLNNWLIERGFEPITWHEHDGGCDVEAVIGAHKDYWDSTFTISVITSLIRSCVYKPIVNGISELFAAEPTLEGFMDKVDKHFVLSNRPVWKQLLYKNYQYDGTKLASTPIHIIHNAGLQNWFNSGVFA